MLEIDRVRDPESARRQELRKLVAVAGDYRFLHLQEPPRRAQLVKTGAVDELHERRAGAIADGQLRSFHLDARSIDSGTDERGEQMLHRPDAHSSSTE